MRSFWKVFVALALMLPLGAFVAGTLVASAADDPAPRDTIIIDDQSGTPSSDPSPTDAEPADDATRPQRRRRRRPSGDASDDDGGDDDGDDDHAGTATHDDDPRRRPRRRRRLATTTAATTTPGRAAATDSGSTAPGSGSGGGDDSGTAATTVAATTTDPETTGARPERSGVSVRVRITAAVALLTLLALTGAGLIVYVIEAQRIDQDISDRVDQQFERVRRSSRNEPRAPSFATVGALLDAFLEVEVPADDTRRSCPGTTAGPQNKSAGRLHR